MSIPSNLPSLFALGFFSATLPALSAVNFEKQILPVLETKCFSCHKAPYTEDGRLKKPKADLRLDAASGPVQHLRQLIGAHRVVTLLYGAHDTAINHAVVLQAYLHDRFEIDVDD